MYNPRDIIDLIAANVRKTRNPFGVPSSQFNTWWREAAGFTRRPGDALLFTGLMYQAIPYIEATTRYLERLEGTRWADYLRFGRFSRYLPGFLVGRGFSFLTSTAEKKKFNGILVVHLPLTDEIRRELFLSPGHGFLQRHPALRSGGSGRLCGARQVRGQDPEAPWRPKNHHR